MLIVTGGGMYYSLQISVLWNVNLHMGWDVIFLRDSNFF